MIPTNLVKQLAQQLAPALTLLYQASLDQGQLLEDWKIANVIPVFKKGNRSHPSNYRPISLTSICCKILEHIVYSNVLHHLQKYNILCEEQHGFRSGRSCETQLLNTINDLTKNLNERHQTDVILLDFSKAFDRVPHQRLCHKLSFYGIRGDTLSWIRNFLIGRHQKVTINGCSSNCTTVTSGVPQGTVLAPLLFLCYINDLPKNVISKVKLYADDVLLYNTIHTEDDCLILQEDLHSLQLWANKWQMIFNLDKCELIRITNAKQPILYDYTIENKKLKTASSVKYLGVHIDEHLTWKEHIKHTISKANSARAFLQRNIDCCPMRIKDTCYKMMVRPIIEYAAIIWSPHTQSATVCKIETVQRKAARFVCNNYYRYSSVTNMLQQLGWPTLERRRSEAKATMMYKIINNLVQVNQRDLICNYSNTRGHPFRFIHLPSRIDVYCHSYFPSAIRIWNNLPESVILSTTLDLFKYNLCKLETVT